MNVITKAIDEMRINDLLDDEPPVTSNAGNMPGNGNTFPAHFDALGRYMFLTLEANF